MHFISSAWISAGNSSQMDILTLYVKSTYKYFTATCSNVQTKDFGYLIKQPLTASSKGTCFMFTNLIQTKKTKKSLEKPSSVGVIFAFFLGGAASGSSSTFNAFFSVRQFTMCPTPFGAIFSVFSVLRRKLHAEYTNIIMDLKNHLLNPYISIQVLPIFLIRLQGLNVLHRLKHGDAVPFEIAPQVCHDINADSTIGVVVIPTWEVT